MKKTFSLFFLYYLRFFARLQLHKIRLWQSIHGKKIIIVGITGSAGKTSCLNACEAVLKNKFLIKTNSGSNSESGIPLNILGIKATNFRLIDWLKYALLAPIKLLINWQLYDIYLVEMGIDGPNSPQNMSYLLTILKPTVGIFLNVNLVHSHNFDHHVSPKLNDTQRTNQILNLIGQEKAKLINSLPSTGHALLNQTDQIVQTTTKNTQAKIIPLQSFHIQFKKNALPSAFQISLSAAINLAIILGQTKTEAISNLQTNLILPPSRTSLFKGVYHSQIIDSSYNSSPLACTEMLSLLATFSTTPRIAILGDMRELGQQSKNSHLQIYQTALKSANTIISVGPETKKYFGLKAIKFDYWWQASDYLLNNQKLISHATILIKGSQNTIFLEEIVKSLLENPSDSSKICRQSPYWLNTKKQFRSTTS